MGDGTGQPAIDQAIATFKAAADRCGEFPDFRFSNGDIWAYEAVERYDPALFKRIQKLIRKRQWCVINGTYTQPDEGIMTDAGWVRQFEIGTGYCREKLGVIPKVFFSPNARTLPGFLPDLLASLHYKGMYVYLPDWPESLPSPLFRWKGPEGGEVLCSRIHPEHMTRSDDLYGQIMEAVENGSLMLGHVPCPYGLGPWGGGPTKASIEYLRQHKDAFRDVLLKFSTYEEFMGEAFLMSDSFPVVEGALGPVGREDPDRRCTEMRRRQMRTEVTAIHAERIPNQIADKARRAGALVKAASIWKDLLMAATVPVDGSSGLLDREAAESLQGRAETNARELIHEGMVDWLVRRNALSHHQQFLVQDMVAVSGHDKSSWVEAVAHLDGDTWGTRMLTDQQGQSYPVQLITDTSGAVRFLTKVPLNADGRFEGLIRIPGAMDPMATPGPDGTDAGLRVSRDSLSNGKVVVALAGNGRLTLSHEGPGAASANPLQLGFTMSGQLPDDSKSGISWHAWEEVESGPLRAAWESLGSHENNRIHARVEVFAAERRVKFELVVDWKSPESALDLVVKWGRTERWTPLCGLAKGGYPLPADGKWHPFQSWVVLDNTADGWTLVSPDLFDVRMTDDALILRLAEMTKTDPEAGSRTNSRTASRRIAMEWVMGVGQDTQALTPKAWSMIVKPAVAWSYDGMQRPAWGNRPPEHLWGENEKRAIKDGQMRHLGTASS